MQTNDSKTALTLGKLAREYDAKAAELEARSSYSQVSH
jgi:hypothetical protein